MNNNYTLTEQLIRYLDHELTEEEKQALEQVLLEDPAAREELDRLKIAANLAGSFGLQQNVRDIHQQMMAELSTSQKQVAKPAIVRPLVRYSLRIAASIVIFLSVSVFYQYMTASAVDVFERTYAAYQLPESRSGNATLLDSLFKARNSLAITSYFEKDSTHSIHDLFLAGNAYLDQEKPVQSIRCFEEVISENQRQESHLYLEDANYYLAMAYLKNNQPSKALPILQAIHSNPQHAYHDKITSWDLLKLRWSLKSKG